METIHKYNSNLHDIYTLAPNHQRYLHVIIVVLYPNYDSNKHYMNSFTIKNKKELP